MSRTSRLTIVLLVLLVPACAGRRASLSPVTVPDNLRPGSDASLAMIVAATGVQIYECRARKEQAGAYE
jgi:hypothetical protein